MVYLKANLFLATALGLLTTTHATPISSPSSASSALIIPRQGSNTTALTTTAWDYVGGSCSDGINVATGTITAGSCFKFYVYAYNIAELPDVDCTFTTYNGDTCQAGQEDTVYQLPKGDGKVCAWGGAVDGGLHYLRSGKLVCA